MMMIHLLQLDIFLLNIGIETSQASDSASASTEIAKSSVDVSLGLPCYSFAVKVRPDLDFQALTDAL